jgi:hypothetical protein
MLQVWERLEIHTKLCLKNLKGISHLKGMGDRKLTYFGTGSWSLAFFAEFRKMLKT